MVWGYLPAIDEDGSRVILLTIDSPLQRSSSAFDDRLGTQTIRGPRGEVLLGEGGGTFVDLSGRRFRILEADHVDAPTTASEAIAEPG
jgi:hypothetical protein